MKGPRLVAAKALLTVLTNPRSVVTSCLEVAGLGLIVVGFGRISSTAELFAAGVALIVVGAVQG